MECDNCRVRLQNFTRCSSWPVNLEPLYQEGRRLKMDQFEDFESAVDNKSTKAAEKLLALDPFALDEETPEEKTAREVAEAETRKTTEVKSEQKVETKVPEVKIDVPVELTDEQIE